MEDQLSKCLYNTKKLYGTQNKEAIVEYQEAFYGIPRSTMEYHETLIETSHASSWHISGPTKLWTKNPEQMSAGIAITCYKKVAQGHTKRPQGYRPNMPRSPEMTSKEKNKDLVQNLDWFGEQLQLLFLSNIW